MPLFRLKIESIGEKMDNKIKKIDILTKVELFKTFEVGRDGVVEIEDHGIEYENTLENLYCVFGENKKLLNRIENCSTIITFK